MLECDDCRKPCTEECHIGCMSQVEMMELLGNGHSQDGYRLFYTILKAVDRGRKLHKVFAEGKYQGLGRIGAEYGELVRAVEKNEGTVREKEEVIDNIVVLIRYWLEEYDVLPEK